MRNLKIRLSIIIPVYNTGKYLPSCLDSLVKQNLTTDEYEIIIVNDGSTDNSPDIASDFARLHYNVILINQGNRGVGAARNRGLDAAQGNFVYFIDPDDYLCNSVLPIILGLAEKNSLELLGFCSKTTESYLLNTSESHIEAEQKLKIQDGFEFIKDHHFKNEIWWYIISRDHLASQGVRFIEGRWMEDAIFTATILIRSKRIAYLRLDAHRHVKVPNSAMTSKEPRQYNRVIYDNANAAKVYTNLISSLMGHERGRLAKERLTTRKESFVFFLIARAVQSNLKFNELWEILKDMMEIRAYPMRNFIGTDYKGLTYRSLIFIFNRKPLLYLFFKSYRWFKSLKNSIVSL